MFFDPGVMEKECLLPAWRAAHDAAGDDDEEQLPAVCGSIERWIKRKSDNPSKKLALRTAAVLLAGGAKLCLKRSYGLLKDSRKLDKEVTFIRKRPRLDSTGDGQTSSENSDKSSAKTPETMMGRPVSYGSTHITYRTKRVTSFEMSPLIPDSPNVSELYSRTFDEPSLQPANDSNMTHLVLYSPSLNESMEEPIGPTVNLKEKDSHIFDLALLRKRRSSWNVPQTRHSNVLPTSEEQGLSVTFSVHREDSGPDNSDFEDTDNSSQGSMTPEDLNKRLSSPLPQTADKCTQTDQDDVTEESPHHQFYETMPFAYVLIHEDYHSRLPNKIMFTSLNSDVGEF